MKAGHYGDFDHDIAAAVLEEAGRFASDVLAPLNRVGDEHGIKLDGGNVTTAPGWPDAYRRWTEAGWNAVSGPEAFGGQGLPLAINAVCTEIWSASNIAFGLCPLLTLSAIEALEAHGSDALKKIYLEKLVSGEWPGTMQLTEPQAGSDVGALRTRAERASDGNYRVKGTKIFITYGDHDMSDNIVHFVLARLPDAPAGTKGISLFLIPKFLVNADGSLGARNDIYASGIEHKLGMHAAPTCTMTMGDKGGAIGYLIGEENRGMHCMFTMMNQARLGVGLEGVGIADRAYQQALAFAQERRQGRAIGKAGGDSDPIIVHPDVKRMLMQMRALTAAARTICYATAVALDVSVRATEAKTRAGAAARGALLTPIAKAFSTDIGNEVASLGVQIHGGMGFIEETGAAQHYRDARITPIYEGTNGIQSIDLVTRKLAANGGKSVGSCSTSSRRSSNRSRPRTIRRSARRAQNCAMRSLRSIAPAAGCSSASPRHRTKPWPAPRLICGCSARRSAAACWQPKPWPRAVSAEATRNATSPWRASSPKAFRCRRPRWSAP